jgi:malic enzyme
VALNNKFPWNYSEPLPVSKRGNDLIRDPLLNKSSAFTARERREFDLEGLLPTHVNTLAEQARRTYPRIHRITDPLEQYVALAALQERNEHLFFRVLEDHLEEFMPVVYTPTVGLATRNFSEVFQRGRGLWITPDMRGRIHRVMREALRERQVALLVATDNEAILGIGDQGAGGMAIAVGKLALYTACAGIPPGAVLPVSLDVGTDNRNLLANDLYLGWREPRLRGTAYLELLDEFVAAVADCCPGAVVQWEDFRKDNALRILDRYRHQVPSFNDDIQGTGAVALAGILSACRLKDEPLAAQRIVISGAGAAGLGIARQIRAGLRLAGLTDAAITERLAVLDSSGLLVADREFADAYKAELAWPAAVAAAAGFGPGSERTLQAVVEKFRPTVLLGASGQAGAFTESLVRSMAAHVAQPVILPFSNPTDIAEAVPADLLEWTDGKALVATGSPFAPVDYQGRRIEVGQGNNVFIFPGVGLGALLAEADEVSDSMLSAAADALAAQVTDAELARGLLFPAVTRLREVALHTAVAVIEQAQREGHGAHLQGDLVAQVRRAMWEPRYTDYVVAG